MKLSRMWKARACPLGGSRVRRNKTLTSRWRLLLSGPATSPRGRSHSGAENSQQRGWDVTLIWGAVAKVPELKRGQLQGTLLYFKALALTHPCHKPSRRGNRTRVHRTSGTWTYPGMDVVGGGGWAETDRLEQR